MTNRDNQLWIDMEFEEAMERFCRVDPREVQANINKRKQRPAGSTSKENPAKPKSVISLSDLRNRRYYR
jgi:hypothetical protein